MEVGAGDDDVRMFRLSVDVRSFKAGLRLPMKAINAYVKVVLPPEIVEIAMGVPNSGNAAKLTAPLRTHPPLMVQKGSEITLSNGYVSLELPASVSGLAAALAQDPRLQAQIFHRDKYAADSLIGSASIPMAPLMKEPWLDGYAPVYAPPDKADVEGQVNVGSLRVVLSAEELGHVSTSAHKPEKEALLTPPSLEDPFLLLKKSFQENLGSKVVGVQTESLEDSDEKARKRPSKQKSDMVDTVLDSRVKKVKSLKGNQGSIIQNQLTSICRDRIPPAMQQDEKLRRQEMEWEFERWRRIEEAKWQANLKQKEMKRLAELEADWKQKERELILDIDKTRTELNNLEAKFRTKIFALEKRERALVLAEEESTLRREAWTRECTQRAADAEVAVKRLQSECEHRVELERAKYTALKEQYSMLEKRLAMANNALSDLEKQFCTYKIEHWKTSEAELIGQVMLLKQQYSDLQRKCEHAVRTKNDYKTQVQRMARELAKLHRQHTQDEANRQAQNRGHLALQSLVEAQARKNEEERSELRQLKEQLEHLQIHEQVAAMAAKTAGTLPTTIPLSQNVSEPHASARNPSLTLPPPVHRTADVSGEARKVNYGAENREEKDEGVQVDLSMDNFLMEDSKRHGVSLFGQDTEGLDDWLAEDLNILLPNLEQDEDLTLSQLRKKIVPDDVVHARPSHDDDTKAFDLSPYHLQFSEFQDAEIRRLTKQRVDLLKTGVYTEEDRIIKGIDQEIKRLQSVDTKRFKF